MRKIKIVLACLTVVFTLTACGGGGGSGISAINNFVQEDFSNLSGSSSIVSSYSSLLSEFQATISGGEFGALQAVISKPDTQDIKTAKTLLRQLIQAESLWARSETLIDNQSNTDKYKIYNSSSYKEAYAAIVYLRDHVKPIIVRVSEGKTITIEQLNKVAKENKAQEIITEEKNSTALEYANSKQIVSIELKQSTEETYNQIENGTPVEDFSNSNWVIIEGQGGKEKRVIKVTTPQTKVVKTKTCTWQEITKLSAKGTAVIQSTPTCYFTETSSKLSPKVEELIQYQEGANPVVTSEKLPDAVSDVKIEWNSSYGNNGTLTTTTKISISANKPEVVQGLETTSSTYYTKTRTEVTGTKNQVWIVVDNWRKTTVSKPAISMTSDNVVYKDTKTKQKRTWTISIKRKKVTYKDGSTEIIETPQAKVYSDWMTVQIGETFRTVKENEIARDIFLAPDITDTKLSQASKTLKNNAYTSDDEDLGARTIGLSTVANDFKTIEFNRDNSKSIINADKAYARGWTGKGAVLGVIDSYQQTNHEALDGKYKWYNDYVRYENGETDSNGNELGTVANGGKNISHGTHVAGIVAGKKDGSEFHGVAFDAHLVGANIDYYGRGSAHMSFAANALQDITKLKSITALGGEGMNIVAINMSFNKTSSNFHYGIVSELSDGTYSAPKISNIMEFSGGGAQYWKVATDNDIILVNSAGNGLYIDGLMNYDFALDPGIWATQIDASGDLILGGKMIIVGNWGGSKADGQVVGSKAGHVCLNIKDDICADTYKTSDFYILAPGNSVYSSASGDGYLTLGGSSMAAPQVTGAIGILHQMWPHMKGDNLVKLVLNTADTNINGYDVNIHGQGLLDLDEATQPQGALGVPTTGRVDGTTTSINNTYFATGNTSAFSSLSSTNIMIVDEFNRDYYLNLGSTFTAKDNRKFSNIELMSSNNYIYLPINQSYGTFAQGGQYNLINNYSFGIYTDENGRGDYSVNLGRNFNLQDNLNLKTKIGQISEKDTWLGNQSDGVLAVGHNNNTNFGSIGIEYKIKKNLIRLNYMQGFSNINTSKKSIIKNFSDVNLKSYSVSYELYKDAYTTLGWSLSVPSHITSGKMDLEVGHSVNLDGTINFKNINSDLAQSTVEKNFGFYYTKKLMNNLGSSYNFSSEYRQDVAGQIGKDEINLALKYVKYF